MMAIVNNTLGGTGVTPVVSGVTPETFGGCAADLRLLFNQCAISPDEIRRDAEFHGRDVRATRFQS